FFFLSQLRRTHISTLFPYTTLFRSTDEISFNSDKLTSKVMSEHERFPSATCSIAIDSSSSEKIIRFKATIKNPDISKIKWEGTRSEEHTSELQSRGHLVCRLLLEKK